MVISMRGCQGEEIQSNRTCIPELTLALFVLVASIVCAADKQHSLVFSANDHLAECSESEVIGKLAPLTQTAPFPKNNASSPEKILLDLVAKALAAFQRSLITEPAPFEREDRFRFRTPSLRNVAETGPYMHDGSQKSLEMSSSSICEAFQQSVGMD
jgi:hypothetical protein